MSEAFDTSKTEQPSLSSISHRRILWIMCLVAFFGGLAGFIFVSRQFGFGILFGGILSLVNYYWLKISLKKIFDKIVESGEKPRFLAARYFGRYLTLGAILTIVFLSKIVPVVAVVLGLTSFALAIVIEGLIRLFLTFFQHREL